MPILSLIVATFVGHFVHVLIHRPWTGPFYRGHMEHHLEHYPPGNLVSAKYKMPKWHNSGPVLFVPAFLIIILVTSGLTWLFSLPVVPIAIFCATLLAFGIMNDIVHDSFHVERSIIHNLPGFAKMRELHFIHHHNMRKNFGIIVYFWDRVFKTLK